MNLSAVITGQLSDNKFKIAVVREINVITMTNKYMSPVGGQEQ